MNYLFKLIIKLLSILILCVASSAYAVDFSGVWNGTGSYETESGSRPAQVKITIDHTLHQINSRDCWSVEKSGIKQDLCTNYQFDILGNNVFFKGIKVGTINENEIQVSFIKNSNAIEAKLNILSDETLNFFYIRVNPNTFTKATALGLKRNRYRISGAHKF